MTTTPLPPLPEPFINLAHTPGAKLAWGAQMQAYATQARADLEAKIADLETMNAQLRDQNTDVDAACGKLEKENQRLREALQEMTDDYADRFDLESPSTNPGIKYVIKQARAALEKQS